MSKFKTVNWNPDLVSRVFTIESEEKTRTEEQRVDIFQRTHVPIDKIMIEAASPEFEAITTKKKKDFINEEDLFTYFEKYPKSEKRVIIIKGGVGSGKSELAESINFKFLNHKNIIPIIFPRSEINLNDIFEKINNKFHLKLHYRSLLKYELRTIIDYILNQADMFLQDEDNYGSEVFTSLIRNSDSKTILYKIVSLRNFKNTLRKILNNSIKVYIQNIKKHGDMHVEFKLNLAFKNVLKSDFNIRAEKKILDITQDIEVVFRKIIHDYQKIPSFNQIVEEIYEITKDDRRILFIFEDATGFGFAESLINFAFDRKLKPCDIIIAWTDGYIQDKNLAATNYEQRTNLVLSLSDNKKSFFLNEASIIEMAKRYIDTLKELSAESIDKQVLDEFVEIEEHFGGLFPFNERCLLRIFHNLRYNDEKKQSPRIFLAYALRDILLKRRIPELNEPDYFKIPMGNLKLTLELNFPQFFSIVYLYGKSNNENDKILEIDYSTFKFLGCPITDEIIKDLSHPSIKFIKDKKVILKLRKPMAKLNKGEKLREQIIKDAGTDDQEIETKLDDYDLATEDFSNWIKDGKRLKKRNELEKGLSTLFDFFSEKKFSQFNSYSYSSVFIDIEKGQENRPEIRLFIPKDNNADHDILELCFLNIGILNQKLGDLIIKDQSFNHMNCIYWNKNIRGQFELKFEKKLRSKLGIDFSQLILLLKTCSIFLSYNKINIDYLDLIRKKYSAESLNNLILTDCPNCRSRLKDFACSSCKIIFNPTIPIKNLNEIHEFFGTVDEIFEKIYKISNDFYNFPLIEQKIENNGIHYDSNGIQLEHEIFDKIRDISSINDGRMDFILSSKKKITIEDFISDTKRIFRLLDDSLTKYNLRAEFNNSTADFLKKFGLINFIDEEIQQLKNNVENIKKLPVLSKYHFIQNFNYSLINPNFHTEYEEIIKQWKKINTKKIRLNFFEINKIFIFLNQFFKKNFEMYLELDKITQCHVYLKKRFVKLRAERSEVVSKLESFKQAEKNCIIKFHLLKEELSHEQ